MKKRAFKANLLEKLKSISKREANLFFSLCEDQSEVIKTKRFKEVLLNSGLKSNDNRLYKLFQNLDAHGDKIVFEDFIEIVRTSELLVEKALRGELAIPDFGDFSKNLDSMFEDVKKIKSGELASYIPPLAEVDPDQFGVAIVTTDGQIYQRGDCNVDFSIQSMCKPFNYCFAMEKLGLEKVHKHVGQEPSGRQFDDLTLLARTAIGNLDGKFDRVPFNPMVNAGAIMTAGLIGPEESHSQRLRYIRQQFGRLIGWSPKDEFNAELPRFNKDMARQENFTGYNNIAMGYLLMATGNLPHTQTKLHNDIHPDEDEFDFYTEPAVTEALKLYFSICSLEMTSVEFATAAATLANSGVCPITQDRVLSQKTVRNCLPVLQTSGMYNASGTFFQQVGLPAKSGVGGGVLLIVPRLMGICIFSPRLDKQGNSVRGLEMAKRLTSKYLVHIFDGTMTDTSRLDPKLPIARWLANSCGEAIWAASNGNIRTLESLVSQQRDLAEGDYDFRTPLHLASAEGQLEVVKFLLDQGVKPRADRWGGYPISDARNNNHQKIVDIFEKLNINYTEPFHLVENPKGKSDKIAKFDDELMVIELLFAATRNDVEGIRHLVAKGVPINAGDYDLRTALHLASAEGSLEVVKYLVSHGHPLFVRDRWGATPLDEAKREKRSSVYNFLKTFK
jgi:glutaminase